MSTAQTRSDLYDLIQVNLTDPLNGQNTAARVREVAEALAISSVNVLEDGVGGGGIPDLAALIAKINSKQDKAAVVAQDAYGPGNPSQPLNTVLEQLAYLLTSSPALGRLVDQQQALALASARKLKDGSYVVADYWNQLYGGVVLTPINVSVFGTIGYIYLSGEAIPVIADLDALTFETLEAYITRIAGGGTSLPTRDLLDLPTAFMDAVIALTYTDCDADPAASPDGSFPGQWFDARVNGQNRRYSCGRSPYDSTAPAGTTGQGPAWSYFQKLG